MKMKLQHMKWYYSFVLLLVCLPFLPINAKADVIDINGGVMNEYKYQEVVFISGQPIVFSGEGRNVSITKNYDKDTGLLSSENYKFTLTGPSGEKLVRQCEYKYDSSIFGTTDVGKIKKKTLVTSNGDNPCKKEEITIGGTKYTLKDYQYSKSSSHVEPAVAKFYMGIVNARKTYSVSTSPNQDIIIYIEGKYEGYDHYWGRAETANFDYTIKKGTDTYTVQNVVSTAKSGEIEYQKGDAYLSILDGVYVQTAKNEVESVYKFDINSNTGTVTLQPEIMTTLKTLAHPPYNLDSIGNDSEKLSSIMQLYGLNILGDESTEFSPNTPITRYDFTVAIAKLANLRIAEDVNVKKNLSSAGKLNEPFRDISSTRKDYEYFVAAYQAGIVQGTTATTFNPDGNLVRQQAAAIIVRLLGLDQKAASLGYRTSFKDDSRIPNYARNSVVVVNELGIMKGDPTTNLFKPTGTLTRAQSALMLTRIINYLDDELLRSYREDILYYMPLGAK